MEEEEDEEEESVEILKPRTDKREYRRVVLPNDLQVLIISDPDTDKVACCFCWVPVSFSFMSGRSFECICRRAGQGGLISNLRLPSLMMMLLLLSLTRIFLFSSQDTREARMNYFSSYIVPVMLLADHSRYWFLMPKQAAAAMAVNVGSFNDPVGLEGLAHFLGTHWCLLQLCLCIFCSPL